MCVENSEGQWLELHGCGEMEPVAEIPWLCSGPPDVLTCVFGKCTYLTFFFSEEHLIQGNLNLLFLVCHSHLALDKLLFPWTLVFEHDQKSDYYDSRGIDTSSEHVLPRDLRLTWPLCYTIDVHITSQLWWNQMATAPMERRLSYDKGMQQSDAQSLPGFPY